MNGDSTVSAAEETSPAKEVEFREAFALVKPKALAMPATLLLVINLDIGACATTALGCAPKLKRFRDQIVKELPLFPIDQFDDLSVYALAAWHAHALLGGTSVANEPVQELNDELVPLRELLLSDVTALGKRKILDAKRLDEIKGAVGYKNIAYDVTLLCSMLRAHWPAVVGKSAVQLEEIDHAEHLARQLVTAVGERDQALAVATEASDMRQRCFTLFMKAYAQVRRAVVYLRYEEGDADSFVPSLYLGRRGPTKQSGDDDATLPATPAVPAVPAPVIAAPALPFVGSNGSTNGARPVVASGMPGDDPFR